MRTPVIRSMTLADLDEADRVLRAAFGGQRSYLPRLGRYLAIDPAAWFVAEDAGALVGTVGAMRYGGFAYVGLLAVAPSLTRRGLGRRLFEHALAWLDERGIGCTVLDATADGASLYQRLGFVDVGTSHELVATGEVRVPTGASCTTALASAAELQEVIDLDRALFGADRSRLWRRLLGEQRDRLLVARHGSGAAAGYLYLQDTLLGPWAASTPDAARALLAAALGRPTGQPLRAQLPGATAAARTLLTEAGFVETRTLRHMRRGNLALAPAWQDVYGKACFCLG